MKPEIKCASDENGLFCVHGKQYRSIITADDGTEYKCCNMYVTAVQEGFFQLSFQDGEYFLHKSIVSY